MKYKIYKPIIFLILLLLTIIFGFLAFKWSEQRDTLLGISTTFFGILVTVFLVDWLIRIAEDQKWSRIREKLVRNLGRALLKLIIRLRKGGNSPTINIEKLNIVDKHLNESSSEDYVKGICDDDEIFNKQFLSPIYAHRAKYILVSDELKRCIEKSSEIIQSQNYGIKPDTESHVLDFIEVSRNFSKSLIKIIEGLSKEGVTLDKLKGDWVYVQENYYNLVKESVTLFFELTKSGFKLRQHEN